MYDLIIIGGGPAGVAAGVYAARKCLKTLLITPEWGGQSVVSPSIENWIGTPTISGEDLAKSLKAHLETYARDMVTVKSDTRVTSLGKTDGAFAVGLADGTTATSRSVLVASGANRRKLSVPGAEAYEHKGLTYCASCDGPLFAGQDVAVVGGGNAGFETAAQLLAYAKSVTLLHHHPGFKADPITVAAVTKHPNMRAIANADVKEVKGAQFASGLVYTDKATGETIELPVTGIFVEIGVMPSTEFAKDFLELDGVGRIKADPRTQRTSVLGVWAAGDCTDELYHQNNIAAGDAVKALEDLYLYLKTEA